MAGPPVADPSELGTAVSDAVSRIYLEKFGKGPLHATTFVNGDVLTTVLHDVFTPVERELVASGRSDGVLTNRMLWQEATDHVFKQQVGEAIGRRILTVVSGYEVHDEVATEVFILESE